MRSLSLILLLVACGPKNPPETAATTAPAPVEAAPAPEPEPEPEAPPEPPPEVNNADLNITVTQASGTAKAGHVKRIERSTDWFGEEGWSTEEKDLKISLEKGNSAKDATWKDIKSIAITPGAITDVDCVYDGNYSPWMYDCTIKTNASVTLKDGTSGWTVVNRHKWRLTYDDGSQVEFWLYKHPAREQDDKVVDLETTNPENFDLYTKLQTRLKSEIKTTLVTKVTVQ